MDHLVHSIGDRHPRIAATAWVAPGAVVVGDVQLGPGAAVFYGAVLRADSNTIVIGARTNLQDGVVVHVDADAPVSVGEDVSVGHRAVLHGCTVEDGCLIGMSATVMNGAVIGAGSMVAAGALVTPGKIFGPGVLIAGVPAKELRPLRPEEREHLAWNAEHYQELASLHRDASVARR